MTKEKLEKEAEEYASMYARQYLHNDGSGLTNSYCEVYNAYYQSAEPREKQIEIDAEQIRALQKQNGELTDENERLKGDLELWESGACRKTNLDKCGVVKELEAQIEKMKNCRNCKNEKIEGACGHFTQVGWCKNWELAD